MMCEAKETPAEYLTIELLLSGGADLPAMAVATAVAMTAASCLSFLEAKAEELAFKFFDLGRSIRSRSFPVVGLDAFQRLQQPPVTHG